MVDLFGNKIIKPSDKGSRKVFATIGASNHVPEERAQGDYYATPEVAVEELLKLEYFENPIIEPCCGGGHIAKVLEKHGYFVDARDLYDRGYGKTGVDFLKCAQRDFRGSIITNPPYELALEFCKKGLEVLADGAKMAMFLKLTFAEGKKRKTFFEVNPPMRVWVSSSRLACGKNGTEWNPSAVCYAWWIWVKGYKGATEMKWFN